MYESVENTLEEKEGIKTLYLRGIMAQAEIPNKNHRYYPINVLEREVNRYIEESVTPGSAVGEMGHPEGPNLNADRVCIKIEEITKDNNNFLCKARVLTGTDSGNNLKGLIEGGVRIGISTRALGSLKPKNEGVQEVCDDLKLIAADIVLNPSAPDAYLTAISESNDWIFNPLTKLWEAKAVEVEEIIEQVVEIHKQELEIKPAKTFDEAKMFIMMEQYLNALIHTTKKENVIKEDTFKSDLIKMFLPDEKHHLIKH